MPPRRSSSAESAARFLVLRSRREPAPGRQVTPVRQDEAARLLRWMAQVDLCAAAAPPGRVVVDFGRATLERIHEILLESMHAAAERGEITDHLTFVAEQMVAQALGMPPCDDPPLTDREVG